MHTVDKLFRWYSVLTTEIVSYKHGWVSDEGIKESSFRDILRDMDEKELRSIIYNKKRELNDPVYYHLPLHVVEQASIIGAELDIPDEHVYEVMRTVMDKQLDPVRKCIRVCEYELRARTDEKFRASQGALAAQKENIPILDVIEMYTSVRWKRWALIKCPFPNHKDWTPSFSISTKNNRFRCFWCWHHWSQVDFIMHFEWCDLKTAINKFLQF